MSVCVCAEGGEKELVWALHFLWGGSAEKNKLHLVNWETISALINVGGLRVLDLSDMNAALPTEWIFTRPITRTLFGGKLCVLGVWVLPIVCCLHWIIMVTNQCC